MLIPVGNHLSFATCFATSMVFKGFKCLLSCVIGTEHDKIRDLKVPDSKQNIKHSLKEQMTIEPII